MEARAWRRKNGGIPLVQCLSIVCGPSYTGLAWRARTSQARVLRLPLRESDRSGAQAHYMRKPPHAVRGRAGTWEHELAPKGRRSPARAVPFHSIWTVSRRLGPARAHVGTSEAHVLGLVLRESERSGAQARYMRKPPHAVMGSADPWEHKLGNG